MLQFPNRRIARDSSLDNQWQPSQGAFFVVNVATVALFWYDKHQAPAADLVDFGTSSMMGIGAEIINGRTNLVEDSPDD